MDLAAGIRGKRAFVTGAASGLGAPFARVLDGGGALDTAPEAFDRVIATNLRGVWLMSVAAAERWRQAKRGGAIVNIASILGFRVSGGTSAYAVSKAGVVQMTQAHALEWARYGIRVNAIAPGYI